MSESKFTCHQPVPTMKICTRKVPSPPAWGERDMEVVLYIYHPPEKPTVYSHPCSSLPQNKSYNVQSSHNPHLHSRRRKRKLTNRVLHILRHELMHMRRRVEILHPEPLIAMLKRNAIIPILRDPHPIDLGIVDRQHELRLLQIPVAERRPPVRVLDVGEQIARVVVEVRHEGVGVVVDDFVGVLGRQGFERGFEGRVGGRDGGAEGVPLRGGVFAQVGGPDGC